MTPARWGALILTIAIAWTRAGRAQECDDRNLLAGRLPSQWQDIRGRLASLTDEAIAPEGAQWDAPVGVVLDTAAASVTYDLSRPTAISAVYVQADVNDTYQIQGSLDGTPGSFTQLVEIDSVPERGHGLRARSVRLPPVVVRFLRVGEATGDGFYSIAEIAAYCRAPSAFPPVMRQVDAAPAAVPARPWSALDWWEINAAARFEMCLALVALMLLAWMQRSEATASDLTRWARAPRIVGGLALVILLAVGWLLLGYTDWLPSWLTISVICASCELMLLASSPAWSWRTPLRRLCDRWRAPPRRTPGRKTTPGRAAIEPAHVVRNQLLALVGLVSFFAYWNFGAFHFHNYTHFHEAFHYYVGAKYFDELSYLRLYDCASIAEAETPALRRRVELRKITNLRTNLLGDTTEVLAHPERCKQHFSPARWGAFKADVDYFRTRLGVKSWEAALGDHGYNATPVWTVAGTLLANLAPASDEQIWWLTRIDPLLLAGMFALVAWAFGWQALCVALAVFATNFPSRFTWTGGAFLRWDFLFCMTAGVCLIKKDRPLGGGYLLGVSTLLRVFPVFLLLGPLLIVMQQLGAQLRPRSRARTGWLGRLDRSCLRVLLGAALAAATLVPISLATSGGVDGYRAFVQNSQKHVATGLTNYMGWRTVATYKEAEAGRHLFSNRETDPWGPWKAARLRTFHQRRWLYAAGVAGFAGLLAWAVRGRSAWEAAAMATVMIAVVPELTCYFYSFLIVPALLWVRARRAGIVLLAVTAATSFIDWAPTRFLPRCPPWDHMQMPTWIDEQYMWMSVVTLLGFAVILYEMARAPRPPGVSGETAP
jgi:hypothetical protein